MDKIEWDETLESGIKSIDDQHQEILATLNYLILNPGISVRSEEFNDWVIRITDLAQKHFENEESMLKIAGYKDLESHIQEHENIINQLSDLLMNSVNLDKDAPKKLHKIIYEWFENHIRDEDKDYFSSLREALETR